MLPDPPSHLAEAILAASNQNSQQWRRTHRRHRNPPPPSPSASDFRLGAAAPTPGPQGPFRRLSLANETLLAVVARPQPRVPHHPLVAQRAPVSSDTQQHRRASAFASLAFSWLQVFSREGGLRTAISQGFTHLDADQSGSLSLADLVAYADRHGLPRAYARDFMQQALAVASKPASKHAPPPPPQPPVSQTSDASSKPCTTSGADICITLASPSLDMKQAVPTQETQQRRQPTNASSGAGGADGSEAGMTHELTFRQFESFVRSREAGLRRAFNMFDKDRDGVISAADLEASLAHITICCPRTRCVYRCPRQLAHNMLERTRVAGGTNGSSVDFISFRRFFMLLPQTDLAVEYWLRAGSVPTLTEKLPAVHDVMEPAGRKAAWGHLLAGAAAGAVSRTATAPLETLRLAVMTGAVPSGGLVQAASSIMEEQGWRGLYRGNLINVLRSAPQKALDFFAFDLYKRALMGWAQDGGRPQQEGAALQTFAAAGLAGATSWALLYPLETVRSRVTAGLAQRGAGLLTVGRHIAATEGPGALYRGLGWSLAGIFPEASLCYGLHDLLKRWHRERHGGAEPGVLPSLAFGVAAAFTGQLVAFPLETVARRLQVYAGPGGLPAMLQGMLREHGPMVFYRGVGAATLRLVPMAVVSFGTYEAVRAALLALEERAETAAAESEYRELHTRCVPLASTLRPADAPARPPSAAAPAQGQVVACHVPSGSAVAGGVCSPALPAEGVACSVSVNPGATAPSLPGYSCAVACCAASGCK